MVKKLKCKYYNKRVTTCDNGNVQSHDQEESKLNSSNNTGSGTHTLTYDKIIKSTFNRNNVTTIKTNKILTKVLILGPVEKVQWCRCKVAIQRWLIYNYQQAFYFHALEY